MSTGTAAPAAPAAAEHGSSRPVAPSPRPAAPTRLRAGTVFTIIGVAILFAGIVIASVILLPPIATGAALLGIALIVLLRRILFTWPALLFLLAVTIMFIPARRYALPIPLPFALEAYRLMIFIAILTLGFALLFDRSRRWRPVAFGWPLGIFLATLLVSFIANGTRLVETGLATTALSGFFQLGVLLSVFFAVRQLLTSERTVIVFLTVLSWMAVIVSFCAVIERVARVNVFLMLANFLPLVVLREDGGDATRAGVNRAYGSAQHPIALAVMLCLFLPILIYLARYAIWPRTVWNRRIAYGFATILVFGGIIAAISRTAVVVMGVMFLVALVLRPKVAFLLLAFAVPSLLLAMFVVPAQVESMLLSFFDVDTLIASQYTSAGMAGAGRLADLEPAFAEVQQYPFFGQGYGSRIVIGDEANSFILDNQVLGILMEAGALGVAGYAVFMLAPIVMLIVYALRWAAEPRHAMLAFAVAVSIAGYSAALFFFDAFGFFQSFLVHMMLLAVGAWLLTARGRTPRARGRPVRPSRPGRRTSRQPRHRHPRRSRHREVAAHEPSTERGDPRPRRERRDRSPAAVAHRAPAPRRARDRGRRQRLHRRHRGAGARPRGRARRRSAAGIEDRRPRCGRRRGNGVPPRVRGCRRAAGARRAVGAGGRARLPRHTDRLAVAASRRVGGVVDGASALSGVGAQRLPTPRPHRLRRLRTVGGGTRPLRPVARRDRRRPVRAAAVRARGARDPRRPCLHGAGGG